MMRRKSERKKIRKSMFNNKEDESTKRKEVFLEVTMKKGLINVKLMTIPFKRKSNEQQYSNGGQKSLNSQGLVFD